MTLASALSFTFAGFLVAAVGWRPVFFVGGLVDVACGLVLALFVLGPRRAASFELSTED
jgi:MFS family permease